MNWIDPTGHCAGNHMHVNICDEGGASEESIKTDHATIQIVVRGFIPDATANNPVNGDQFKGDNRGPQYSGGTFRTQQVLYVNPLRGSVYYSDDVGQTVNLTTGETGHASKDNMGYRQISRSDGTVVVAMSQEAGDPLVSYAQPLDIMMNIQVTKDGKVTIEGFHDMAPSYEIWVSKPMSSAPAMLIHSYQSKPIWTLGLPPIIYFKTEYQ